MNPIKPVTALLLVLSASASFAEDTLPLKSVNKANEVIDAALEAHGGAERLSNLKTLVQESRYTNYQVDQSRSPEPPWDKGTTVAFNAIDLERGAYVNRASGNGGGFEFDNGTIIDGAEDGAGAWQIDYRGGTAAPIEKPDLDTASGPLVRVTPALLMKQLQARRQQSHWLGETEFDGRLHDVVTLVMAVGPGLSLYFDQETHLLTGMERVLPPFGQVEYRFEDYETIDGIPFNRNFRLILNGDANIDGVATLTKVNVPIAEHLELAEGLARIPPVTPDDFNLQEIDEGVFLVGGNGSYGLLIEAGDHIVAIGGTQGARDRIAEVRKHVGDKPVRHGILTHHHSDHVPAAADYAQEGAVIVTFRENEKVVRKAAGDENARLEFVDDRMTLEAGGRTIELYDIGPTPHAEHLLVAYLPDEKILFEGDHFPQPRNGPMPPAVESTRAFAEAIARLGLDVERIVGEHSPRVGTMADLRTMLERQPATGKAGAR